MIRFLQVICFEWIKMTIFHASKVFKFRFDILLRIVLQLFINNQAAMNDIWVKICNLKI